MICTATINGVLIEASGTPEECAKFLRAITPPIVYGSTPIKWTGKSQLTHKMVEDFLQAHPDQDAAINYKDYMRLDYKGAATKFPGAKGEQYLYAAMHVEEGNIFTSSYEKKVCDPMARHMGNCGAEDCPIVTPVNRHRVIVPTKGQTWIDKVGNKDTGRLAFGGLEFVLCEHVDDYWTTNQGGFILDSSLSRCTFVRD